MSDAKTESTTEFVVARLSEFILDECKPGDRIPSESALAEKHGVSRVTVREAVKVLCGQGFLSVSQGRRATVTEPSSGMMGKYLFSILRNDIKGKFDLLEVRQTLEVQAASLAATNASDSGLVSVRHALDGMQNSVERLTGGKTDLAEETRFHEYDAAFHAAIAWCSGNRLLAHMLEAMGTSLTSAFKLSAQGRRMRGLDFSGTLAAHVEIFEAIQAGDPQRAARAMTSHLHDAQKDLESALNDW